MTNKKLLKEVLAVDTAIVLIIIAISYLLMSFVMGSIDFIEWGSFARFILVLFSGAASGITLTCKHD